MRKAFSFPHQCPKTRSKKGGHGKRWGGGGGGGGGLDKNCLRRKFVNILQNQKLHYTSKKKKGQQDLDLDNNLKIDEYL